MLLSTVVYCSCLGANIPRPVRVPCSIRSLQDIKERKQYLKERVAAQLQSGELNMAELKRMDKQVRDFCLEVAKEWQLTAAEGDGAAEEPRPRLKRCLERMWTRLSLDKNR